MSKTNNIENYLDYQKRIEENYTALFVQIEDKVSDETTGLFRNLKVDVDNKTLELGPLKVKTSLLIELQAVGVYVGNIHFYLENETDIEQHLKGSRFHVLGHEIITAEGTMRISSTDPDKMVSYRDSSALYGFLADLFDSIVNPQQ